MLNTESKSWEEYLFFTNKFQGVDKIDYPIQLEVSDASKNVIETVQKAGGSLKLIHRTPLKLREHMFPEKYLLPLAEPITPWWKIQKILRK